MFGHEAPYDLVVVSTTEFGSPPGAGLHFGDAIVVDEDDPDDSHGGQAVQSLDTSCQSSVASLRSLEDSMFLPTIAGVGGDPGHDGPSAASHGVDPGRASSTLGESCRETTAGVADEDATTEPKDETVRSGQEKGPGQSQGGA